MTEWILWPKLSENMGFMRSPGCNNSRMLNERKLKSSDDDGERVSSPGISLLLWRQLTGQLGFQRYQYFLKQYMLDFNHFAKYHNFME